jgi:hypothetical protein
MYTSGEKPTDPKRQKRLVSRRAQEPTDKRGNLLS